MKCTSGSLLKADTSFCGNSFPLHVENKGKLAETIGLFVRSLNQVQHESKGHGTLIALVTIQTSLFTLNLYMMNTLELKGRWNEVKGRLKQQYANLTDNDLKFEEGKEDELIGRIQKKTEQTKEAITEFLSTLNKKD